MRAVRGGRLRALTFTRTPDNRTAAAERRVCETACRARGWACGVSVRAATGQAGWDAAVRMIRRGAYDLVAVDTLSSLGAADADLVAGLLLLRDNGVRLLVAGEGIDTGDPVGRALIDSIIDGYLDQLGALIRPAIRAAAAAA